MPEFGHSNTTIPLHEVFGGSIIKMWTDRGQEHKVL